MRAALLAVAAIALAAFITVAFVLPQRAAADAAKQQVSAAAQKSSSLAELKWCRGFPLDAMPAGCSARP